MLKYKIKHCLILASILMFGISNSQAQGEPKVMQLSGLVVESNDSLYGMGGAFVYVPTSGRGANTDYFGYFTMPVLAGDSVVVRALGFKPVSFIVPYDSTLSYSVLIEMQEDTIKIPELSISKFPTEKAFKEAFLAMNVEGENYDRMRENLNDKVMNQLYEDYGMDANLNHRYFMQQQVYHIENANEAAVWTRLINPFAWARLIDDIKKQKELKKKKEQEERKEHY